MIISHRLKVIKDCDKIYKLQEGSFVEVNKNELESEVQIYATQKLLKTSPIKK